MARKGEMGRKTKRESSRKKSRSTSYKHGAGDRGSLEFKARVSEQEGEIMQIARINVVTVPPTMNIMSTVKTLINYKLRRVPVCDPGTMRLEGICSVMDIIDFLGGGEKHSLITKKHKGKFIVAVNDDVREIMNKNVITVSDSASMVQALKILQKHGQGGAPVVDSESHVTGTIAEVNFVEQMVGLQTGISVGIAMATKLLITSPDTSIRRVSEDMIQKGYRRIPVVKDGVLIGITSASDILRFLGSGEMFESLVTGDIDDAVSQPIRNIMKTSLITINTRADVGEAAALMMDKWIGSIPVVENGRLIGLITQTDVLKHYPELGK